MYRNDIEFISTIYKKSLQINKRKITPVEKMNKGMSKQFPEEKNILTKICVLWHAQTH